MGRRPDSGDNEVSLFPFLSILACIIGVLTLMIATLALSQMDTEAVAAAEEFEKVEKQLLEKQTAVDQLKQEFDDKVKTLDSDNAEKQKLVEQLQKKLEDLAAQFLLAQKKAKTLDQEKDKKKGELQLQPLDELKAELKEQKALLAQLVKDLEGKKLPPEEAEFSVLPGGSGVGVIPRFIECTKTELVLHNREGEVRVRAGGMETNEDYLKLLNDVAGEPNAKVIFLVRDDGVHVYNKANRIGQALEVPAGKLPVLGHGRINLRHFHDIK